MTRREREAHFLSVRSRGGWSSLSTSLLASAVTLLGAALRERGPNVVRLPDNHFSDNALGAVVLVSTAFDVWLTECFDSLELLGVPGARQKAVTMRGIVDRFQGLAALAEASMGDHSVDDLRLAIETRNEIVHHLGRPVDESEAVPRFVQELRARGLLLSRPTELQVDGGATRTDFTFQGQLASYKLAYWTFGVVRDAAFALVETSRPAVQQHFKSLLVNFELYRASEEIVAPEKLTGFDFEHELAAAPTE